MEGLTTSADGFARPEFSLSIPCYNEEECLHDTIPALAQAFRAEGVSVQLILIDNGSTDRTGEIIDELITEGLPVTKGRVDVNIGQGLGYLRGFELADGRYIGSFCADGQVEPEDVVALCQTARGTNRPTLVKARRRYRQDSWMRKILSIGFNAMMQVIFPGMPAIDVNGNPKILPSDVLRSLELESTDWFLEAEIMLRTWYLRLPTIEVDVFGVAREGGQSHVRLSAVLEFLRNVTVWRFGGPWKDWKVRSAGLCDTTRRTGVGRIGSSQPTRSG